MPSPGSAGFPAILVRVEQTKGKDKPPSGGILSVLGTVPRSRAARRRLYHVRLDTPSAAHGFSDSLLPSLIALAFRALPVCFADRAACLDNHLGRCHPRADHRLRYFSIDRAVACTSDSGSGWAKSWLTTCSAGSTGRLAFA